MIYVDRVKEGKEEKNHNSWFQFR